MVEIALATAAISVTVAYSRLFRPLRKHLTLFRCSYCLSHWIAAALTLPTAQGPIDFIIKTFAAVALATIITWPMLQTLKMIDR